MSGPGGAAPHRYTSQSPFHPGVQYDSLSSALVPSAAAFIRFSPTSTVQCRPSATSARRTAPSGVCITTPLAPVAALPAFPA